MFSCVQSFPPENISYSCVPVRNVGLLTTQQKAHSAYCLTFAPYCLLETNLVTSSAASLKLSAHSLVHNYSEPRTLFEGFKGFRYLFFNEVERKIQIRTNMLLQRALEQTFVLNFWQLCIFEHHKLSSSAALNNRIAINIQTSHPHRWPSSAW